MENTENSRRFVISTFGARGSVLIRRSITTEKNSQKINFFSELESHIDHKKVLAQDYDTKSIDYFLMEYEDKKFDVIYCSAFPFEKIIDTTGAGDMYIGCVCSALVKGFSNETMMKVASFVAGYKCTKPGGSSKGIAPLDAIPFQYQ